MRNVILNVAVSLDGFIEGAKGEYDWCFTDQDYGMKDFLESIDAVFYGRKSYEMILSADPSGANPFGDLETYVFSETLKTPYPGTHLISDNLVQRVKELKESVGKNIWLFGGASLLHTFFENDLVDELSLAVHPILLGEGKPLFQKSGGRTSLNLVHSTPYLSGLVINRYTVGKRGGRQTEE
jgi:dihydrofolate reductase